MKKHRLDDMVRELNTNAFELMKESDPRLIEVYNDLMNVVVKLEFVRDVLQARHELDPQD